MTLAAEKHSFVGGPFGSNLQSKDYTQSGVMIIQLNNIGEGLFSTEKRKFTSTQKADELLSCNAYPGDIIVSKMMPAGRACILPDLYSRYVMGSDAIRVKVDGEKYSNTFICAQINTTRCHKWIDGRTGGSTRQRIGLPVLKELPLYFPTIAEQKTISFFLNLLDKRIQTQNKIIEEQISLEKAIKSMGIYSVSHDTIPLSSVFEVVKEKAGASIKATVYTASAKYGLVDEERFFKKKISSDNTENYTVIRNGDYVFSKSSSRDAPYGAFLAFEGKIGLVSPLYFVLRPRKKLSNVTIESWFSSSHCQKQMGAITQEGARSHGMLNISLKDFLSLRLWQSIPSQYEKVFTAMKLKREIEECLLELLMKQKQFLLQEMFI